MQADPRDRQQQQENRSRHGTQTMVMAIAVLILAGGAYLLAPREPDEPPPEPPAPAEEPATVIARAPQPAPDAAILEAPDIPEREAEMTTPDEPVIEEAPAPTPAPEPTPEELDALVRAEVDAAGIAIPGALASSYSAPWLLDRAVATADQLARGLVPGRTLNLPRPKGEFPVLRDGEGRLLDTAGYQRYNTVTAAITALPAESLAGLFHRFRPQLRSAYAQLGYPADAMDNTLIAALDHVLAAPTVETPIALRSKGALWAFSDPELEGASDVHKQLLRSGPANTRAIQAWVEGFRSALLSVD